MTPALPGPIRQLGYVVADIDAAVAAWTRLGVGPWTVITGVPLASTWRGAASTPVIDTAFGYRGDLQIELIRQRNDAPSPYRECIDAGRHGLHHAACLSHDIAADVARLQAAGCVLACDIRMSSGRYVYFDSPVPGERTYIELLEATPAMVAMFEQGIAAARGWDGRAAPAVIDYAQLVR